MERNINITESVFNSLGLNFEGYYNYGTAGFRLNDINIIPVIKKTAIIAWLLSATSGFNTGIMITASHNTADYNGVKIVGFDGKGIPSEYEETVEKIVNSDYEKFKEYIKGSRIKFLDTKVLIGRDTRVSGIRCVYEIMEMFDKILNCKYEYLDVVTTPQLQYEVHRSNIDKSNYNLNYKECLQSLFDLQKFDDLYIDTANGSTTSFFTEDLPFKVINPQKGIINDNCGTEYVLNNKKLPFELDMNKNTPCAVFDGDGDRLALVVKNDETVTILDGDDLAVIMWDIISNNLNNVINKLNTGVVLSYYSNGAAVNYILDLGITCDVIGAGVKNFTQRAKFYDLCVWFEPNGHGGVYLSKKAKDILEKENTEFSKLLLTYNDKFFNDAIANLLFIKTFASDLKSKIKKIPCKLDSIVVKNKYDVVINENYVVEKPLELSHFLKELNKQEGIRTFVRSSGTENIIRIYVECSDENKLEEIFNSVKVQTEGTCV